MVTASPQPTPSDELGVHAHYVARARTLNDRYNTWIGRRRTAHAARRTPETAPAPNGSATSTSAATTSAPNAPPQGILAWLRKQAGLMLAYPDTGRGWILRAALAARSLAREMEFDAVVSSGPPHSAHIAGMLACIGRREPLYIDMRDPWRTPVDRVDGTAIRDAALLRSKPWLERIILPRAAAVVANTAAAANLLQTSYPRLNIAFVPNGIDHERLPPRTPPTDKFTGTSIAYAGTIYLSRDLTPVLRALSKLTEELPETRGTLRLRIAGRMDAPHEARFRSQVEKYNLNELVAVYGPLPGAEALDLINRSHLTLVLAQDQLLQVPAKLFECVAMGIPTLVIAEASSAAEREARRIGAIACDPEDIDEIVSTIRRIWQREAPMAEPLVAIDYDTIADQMDLVLQGTASASSAAKHIRTEPHRVNSVRS